MDTPERMHVNRDGARWLVGTNADIAWIDAFATTDVTITSAIPPGWYDAYATVVLPESHEEQQRHDHAVIALLSAQSSDQRWWLGYLDTGVDDVVFPEAPTVTLYANWPYVLVQAGPEQAASWRQSDLSSHRSSRLPDLIFPVDRSADLDAMGRRLDLYRRTGCAHRRLFEPPRSRAPHPTGDKPRRGRHPTRPPSDLDSFASGDTIFTGTPCSARRQAPQPFRKHCHAVFLAFRGAGGLLS